MLLIKKEKNIWPSNKKQQGVDFHEGLGGKHLRSEISLEITCTQRCKTQKGKGAKVDPYKIKIIKFQGLGICSSLVSNSSTHISSYTLDEEYVENMKKKKTILGVQLEV